jgi:hypothetical protein
MCGIIRMRCARIAIPPTQATVAFGSPLWYNTCVQAKDRACQERASCLGLVIATVDGTGAFPVVNPAEQAATG